MYKTVPKAVQAIIGGVGLIKNPIIKGLNQKSSGASTPPGTSTIPKPVIIGGAGLIINQIIKDTNQNTQGTSKPSTLPKPAIIGAAGISNHPTIKIVGDAGDDLIDITKVGLKPEGTGNLDDLFEYNWTGEYVTEEFKEKVVDIATKLKMNPDDLMGIMAFESYLDPTTVNFIGATGLIQFMPSTAKELGTTTADLAKMSAIEQLDYVYVYYEPLTGKLNSLSDAYMAVLAGKYSNAVTASDEYVLWSTGSKAYTQNNGLDINGDGSITKAEATKMVVDRRDSYGKK